MAAAVSSVWAKPGAWALEAEEHDAAELQQQQQSSLPSNQTAPSSDFPSLAAAATTKTKKKKGQTLSLAEFTTYKAPAAAPQSERLTQAELVSLPTGPRERSAEELERSRGFRSYGPREDSSSRWGSSRASEDGERRGGGGFNRDRESGRDSGPSRADETDDWAAGKKAFGGNFERRERGPSGGDGFERRDRGPGGGFFESQSKADEADSWVSSKPRFVPSTNPSGGGDRFEKRGSFESLSRNRDSQFGSESDTWGRRREESGGAPPSGGGISRPRLVLQPRTLPVAAVEVKPESPVAVTVERPVIVERPKGANPFGNARPREEVLAEKGQDWKEIDEKLEAVKLKEVAAVIEKSDERSPGKIGFGLGNGRKDDRTDGSWRKSSEQSEETAVEESNKEDAGKEESTKEEANKEEPAKEGAGKKEAEDEN